MPGTDSVFSLSRKSQSEKFFRSILWVKFDFTGGSVVGWNGKWFIRMDVGFWQKKISITCWNVRNLSLWLNRPGIRGRGFDFATRIRTIAMNIERWRDDIVLLLETGGDATENLIPALHSCLVNQYSYLASPVTGQETYTLLWKSEKVRITSQGMVGTTPNQRQGWALLAQDQHGNQFNIIVLHAPYSGGVNNRAQVVTNVLQQTAAVLDFTLPTFVMGDLNFKTNEQNTLQGAMVIPNHNFAFIGPSSGNGPALTSLKKYTTLTDNDGNDVGSQPYDQFWCINQGAITCQTSVLSIVHNPVNEKEMVSQMADSLVYLSNNHTGSQPSGRTPASIQANDILIKRIGKIFFLRQKFDLPHVQETIRLLKDRGVDFSSISNSCATFFLYLISQFGPLGNNYPNLLPACRAWRDAMINNTPFPVAGGVLYTMDRNAYDAYCRDAKDFLFCLNIAASLFKFMAQDGSIGVDIVNDILLEYAISDHSPIHLELTWPN